ncbi:MAG TPA: NAD-dependent epimerase/dehydratase family protein [Solirubrobacterales bacterium]|nr:NAD-dependent epimerase/dehydratase family protein [Solirubrobacterales bacterium]
MSWLVTGGAGFIGSHVVDAVLDLGDRVVVIDDLSTGSRENLEPALAGEAELVEADITDAAAVAGVFETHAPEGVLHLAAQVDVRRSVSDPVFDLSINVAGTVNLLESARRAGTRRFVLASTGGAIYGEGEGRELPLDERAECRPDAPYGQSKYAAEGYLSLYSRFYGLSTAALRLGNVYGPRQDPLGEAGVVAIFCGALLGDGTPRVFGDGLQTRDYVYVADVVEAFKAAAASDVGGTFNIGTGIETSVLELGDLIAEACGRPFEPRMDPPRPGEVQRIAIDSRRAASELGWRSATPLSDGLRATAASFAP